MKLETIEPKGIQEKNSEEIRQGILRVEENLRKLPGAVFYGPKG